MKTIALLLAALLLISATSVAEQPDPRKVRPMSTTRVASRASCDYDGYMSFSDFPNVDVPDNDPNGVWIGPLNTDAGFTIQDVTLSLDMKHTWIGDLIISLEYDSNCDGYPDAEGGVLCRHDFDGCPVDACCGCGGGLDGTYDFDDVVASIEDDCGSFFESGCYGPDYDSPGLGGFDGLNTGGCFWLHVTDGAAGDVGHVDSWQVRILGEPTVPQVGALDILPGSCPNPFNVRANGKLPVAVLGSESFDATAVDAATVALEGVSPLKSSFGDVATPVGPDAEPCECSDLDGDGFTDAVFHFERQDIVQAIGPVGDGDMVELTLEGMLMDGTPFSVSDCVLILSKGNGRDDGEVGDDPDSREAVQSTSWGALKALYR
jgi:hypothetical protein